MQLQNGPLTVDWKPGKLALYWNGVEMTAGPGCYTWVAAEEKKASGGLDWSLNSSGDRKLTATARRAEGVETWEVELTSERELRWRVTLELAAETTVERACAAIIAGEDYCRGMAGRTPFAYEDDPGRVDTTVWAGRDPVRRIALAPRTRSPLPGLAMVLDGDLPMYQFFTGNGPLVQDANTRRVECVRFQNEIVPLRLQAGTYVLADCRILLGGEPAPPLHHPRDFFSGGPMAEVLVVNDGEDAGAMAGCRDLLQRQLPLAVQNGKPQPPRVRMDPGPDACFFKRLIHLYGLRKQRLDLLAVTCPDAREIRPVTHGLPARLAGARRLVWVDPAMRSRWPDPETLPAYLYRRFMRRSCHTSKAALRVVVQGVSFAAAALMAGPAFAWLLATKKGEGE